MRVWNEWLRLLAMKETGESLAIWRILMGLVLLFSLLLPFLDGIVAVIWLPVEHGGYLALEESSWLMDALGGPTPRLVHGAIGIGVLAALALIIGVWSRLAAFVGLQSFLALAWINPHTGGSYDVLITNALWLLVLARSDATWSLQARLREGRWTSSVRVSSWPRYLVILQLLVMYTSTGLQKISAYWVPGGDYSALYYIMQQPTWQREDLSWLANIYVLTQVGTAVIWFWEIFGGVLLLGYYWARYQEGRGKKTFARFLTRLRYRALFVFVGLPMHVMILITMDVGPFSWASMAYYAALWHPDEIVRLFRRVADASRHRRVLLELLALWLVVGLLIRSILSVEGLIPTGWIRDLVLALVPLLFIYAPVVLCRWRASRGQRMAPETPGDEAPLVDSWAYKLSIPAFRDRASWRQAVRLNIVVSLVVVLPWLFCYHVYQTVFFDSNPGRGLRPDFAILALYHLFYVAIPEEFFYRGYFQTRLNEIFPKKWTVLGVSMGWGAVIASLFFAFGHSLVTLQWWHFATFFPGMVFAWMREKTDGVIAGAFFHAICNIAVGVMDYHYGVVTLPMN